jgi:hypothetical protein
MASDAMTATACRILQQPFPKTELHALTEISAYWTSTTLAASVLDEARIALMMNYLMTAAMFFAHILS